MKYFKAFNNVRYPVDVRGSQLIEAVDVMKRVVIKDNSFMNPGNFSWYQIKDGETPEQLAERFYGSQDLYWVILLYNDCFNQYVDWNLGQNQLESYYKYKYPGTDLFLLVDGLSSDVSTKHFNKTDQIFTTTDGSEPDQETLAVVQSWDPSLGKLTVYGITGSSANFTVGATIGATASYGIDGETPTNPGGTGYSTSTARIGKIVSNSYNSVHHFEDSLGKVMNPYGTPFQSNDLQVTIGTTASGGDWSTNAVTFGATVLHDYITGSSTYTITNSQHEDRENNKRRVIRILNPTVVPSLVERFNQLLEDVQ